MFNKIFALFTISLLPFIFVNPVYANSVLWQPAQRPKSCSQVNTQMLVADVSGSMKPLFNQIQASLQQHIRSARDCTYIIVARFGTTADVIADEFLTSDATRDRLQRKLLQLRPTQQFTNLDEAAKLIDLVELKLQNNYEGVPVNLSVTVLSDQLSDPSSGKPIFSLREFFDNKLKSKKLQVLAVEISQNGQSAKLPEDASSGFAELKISVRDLTKLLANTTPKNVGVTIVQNSVPIDTIAENPSSSFPWGLIIFVAVLGTTIILFIIWKKDKNSLLIPDNLDLPIAHETISILLVTESEQGRIIAQNHEIPIAVDIPVIFGTDNNATYQITQMGNMRMRQLFSITIKAQGTIEIVPYLENIFCENQPLPEKGIELLDQNLFTIRYGDRQWQIQPSTNNGNVNEFFNFL